LERQKKGQKMERTGLGTVKWKGERDRWQEANYPEIKLYNKSSSDKWAYWGNKLAFLST